MARSRSPWMPLLFVAGLWLAAPVALASAPSDRDIDRILSSLPENQRSQIIQAQLECDEAEASITHYSTTAEEAKFSGRSAKDQLRAALVRFKAERVALREARQSGDPSAITLKTQAFQAAQQNVFMHRAMGKLWLHRRSLAKLQAAHAKLWVRRCEALVRLRRLELFRDQTSSSDLDLLGEISNAQASLVKEETRANRVQAKVQLQESRAAQWAAQVVGYGGTP